MPIDQVVDDDVASWVAGMSKEAPNGKRTGYSPKTIENAHGFLHSVFACAVKRRLRPDNPADGTRLPKKAIRDEPDMFLTKEKFTTLLPRVPAKYQPHVAFLWGTGAAIGEPQTERSRRTLAVDGATMEYVWPLVHATGHSEFVFPLSKPRTSSTFWKAVWKPTLESAEAKGFTKRPGGHSLRQFHASYLLSFIATPMQDVSDRLGHSSMATTDKVYRHRIAKDGAVIATLIDGPVPALPAPSADDAVKALDPHLLERYSNVYVNRGRIETCLALRGREAIPRGRPGVRKLQDRLSDQDRAGIVDDYTERRGTISELADAHGCSEYAVRQVLRRGGVTPNPRVSPRADRSRAGTVATGCGQDGDRRGGRSQPGNCSDDR